MVLEILQTSECNGCKKLKIDSGLSKNIGCWISGQIYMKLNFKTWSWNNDEQKWWIKKGIRDFITGLLDLVIMVGRICEIDKWMVAMTCKGTNMGRWGAIGQGGNGQWYVNNESQSLYEKDPVSEGSTNLLLFAW